MIVVDHCRLCDYILTNFVIPTIMGGCKLTRTFFVYSSLMKQKRASTGTTTASSHVRVYGGRNTRNSLAANNNQSSYSSTLLSSHNNANNNAAVNASEAAMNGSYIAAANSSSTRNAVGSVNNMKQSQVRENVVQHTVYTTRNSNQAYNNSETNSATIQHQNNNNSGE